MIALALFLFFQSSVQVGRGGSQAISSPIPIGAARLITPAVSSYNYPWPSLAGGDHIAYATPIAEVDNVGSWTAGPSTVVFNAPNTLEVGDQVKPNFFFASGQFFNRNSYTVSAVTPTQVTVGIVNGPNPAINGSETGGAILEKYAGPHWTGNGTWEINLTTPCGGGGGQPACETFKLYTWDGTQTVAFATHPVTSTGTYPFINFAVGPTPGACTTTGSLSAGTFQQHSTIEYDVKFTLDADPTKTSTTHHIVCANGGGSGRPGVVRVTPGYRQAYLGRYIPLVSHVFGNTNPAVDWTVVDAPGNGALVALADGVHDAHHPHAVFYTGTTGSGQYHIKACMQSSPTDCDELTIYVSASTVPAANAYAVEQAPCDNDPDAAFGTVWEIGPTQAHTSILDFPQTYAGSNFIRFHNEGTAGSPTEFHNYGQINIPSSGTFTDRHPSLLICSTVNATSGEYAILDAANATGNTWTSQFVSAPSSLIGIYGQGTAGLTFTGANQLFSFVTIQNVYLRNIGPGFTYTNQTGGTSNWGESYGFRPAGIQYFTTIGVKATNSANPFFDNCNTAIPGWSGCSQDTFYEGNNTEGYGIVNDYLEHPFYIQSLRATTILNLEGGQISGAQGTACFSSRGSSDVRMYNRCIAKSGFQAGYPGGHSEMQDSANIVLPDEYWGYQGRSDCNVGSGLALGCLGQFGGEDWFAAEYEEHNIADLNAGNAYLMNSAGQKFLGISTTHYTTGIDNSPQAWYYYNTYLVDQTQINNGEQFGEFLRQSSDQDPTSLAAYNVPVQWPRMYLQNNIIPWKNNQTGSPGYSAQFGLAGSTLFSFRSNMIATGQVTITANMHPTNDYLFPSGIYSNWTGTDPWNIDPLNKQLSGDQTQFLTYSTYPVNLTTLVPISGSAAIGQATSLTGVMALYPPLFNAVDATMNFTLRTDYTTLGALDP